MHNTITMPKPPFEHANHQSSLMLGSDNVVPASRFSFRNMKDHQDRCWQGVQTSAEVPQSSPDMLAQMHVLRVRLVTSSDW